MTGNIINVKGNYYIQQGNWTKPTVSFLDAIDIIMGYCAIKKIELKDFQIRAKHPLSKLCLSLISYVGIRIYGLTAEYVAHACGTSEKDVKNHIRYITSVELERNVLVKYIIGLIHQEPNIAPLKKMPEPLESGYHKCTLNNDSSLFLKISDNKVYCNGDGYFVQTCFGIEFPYKKAHFKADYIQILLKKVKEDKKAIRENTLLGDAIRVLSLSNLPKVKSVINELKNIQKECQSKM